MLPLNYFLFLQIILFLFITPGTPRIVIISYSMNYGVQKCIWTALGDITANFIQATLVIFVLGSFFLDNPNFLNTFKWIGIIYLMYLAYDVYQSKPKDISSNNLSQKSFFCRIQVIQDPHFANLYILRFGKVGSKINDFVSFLYHFFSISSTGRNT